VDQIAADANNAIADGPFGANLKTEHYIGTPGHRVIRLQNIGRGEFRRDQYAYIDKARFERLSKHHVYAGDLLIAGLVDEGVRCCSLPSDVGPALVKADCYRFSVHPKLSSRFAMYYLISPTCSQFASTHHHGMTLTRIGLGNFRQIPFPLPPLAEQHRIVAKVDELMAVCDALTARLTAARELSSKLVAAAAEAALA
jgi:type I restriction enzyme S subunit